MTKFYSLACLLLACLQGLYAQQPASFTTGGSLSKADSLFLVSDWKNARKQYEVALQSEENKKNALAWNRLAFSCQSLGDFEKAIGYYNISLKNEPNLTLKQLVYSRMAKAYMSKNEIEKSLSTIEEAIKNGYANYPDLDTAKEFIPLHSDSRYKQVVEKATINAFPCMGDEQNREFDFWVGEWNAYVTGTNNLAGHSIIQKASGDCMILENWTSARGTFNGKSMNFVDPVTKKWEQVWVGSDGRGNHVARFINGIYKDGAMRFDFENTDAQGKKVLGRFLFFNEGPNQVRQLNETSSDGKTWTSVYDFTYKRIK